MRTSRYEVFLKIVETQSLTKTAAYFGCTQSAVSQLVKALETELGVSLLIRSKAGVRLTAEGEYLLPGMRQIVSGERSVFERSLELQNMSVGLIPQIVQSYRTARHGMLRRKHDVHTVSQ